VYVAVVVAFAVAFVVAFVVAVAVAFVVAVVVAASVAVALAVVSDSQGAVVLIATFVGLSLMFVWLVAIVVAAVHPRHTLNIASIQTSSPNKMSI
jgi:hypothetical protein